MHACAAPRCNRTPAQLLPHLCNGKGNVQCVRQPRYTHPPAPHLPHFRGAQGDMRACVDHIAAACPNSTLVAAGWSLGGNILLRYLAEQVWGQGGHLEATSCCATLLSRCGGRI
eukprot:342587-Chlamydomonas_euryale.AAC.1